MANVKAKKAKKELTANQKRGRMFLTLAGAALVLTPFTGASETLASVGIHYLTKGDKEAEEYKKMCEATGQMTAEELDTKEAEEEKKDEDNEGK